MPTAPISLYIAVQEDRSIELEVAARAALAFAAGIREVAYQIDPSFEFRFELLRADEGSNWLKAKIRWIRGMGFPAPTMMGVSLAAAAYFADKVADKAFDRAWETVVEGRQTNETMPVEQAQEMVRTAAKAAASEVAEKHFQSVYRELGNDQAVTGVGVALSHSHKPAIIVPRREFQTRSGGQAATHAPSRRRTREVKGDFVIVRPVLKQGGGMWRFNGPEGEFSARIMDEQFIDGIMSGTAPVPLAAEIHITAELEIDEELHDGAAWKPTAYRIMRVHDIRRQGGQIGLIGP